MEKPENICLIRWPLLSKTLHYPNFPYQTQLLITPVAWVSAQNVELIWGYLLLKSLQKLVTISLVPYHCFHIWVSAGCTSRWREILSTNQQTKQLEWLMLMSSQAPGWSPNPSKSTAKRFCNAILMNLSYRLSDFQSGLQYIKFHFYINPKLFGLLGLRRF